MVLQNFAQTYQTLLDKVNEDIYRPLWYDGVSSLASFQG
jgi:hypothetical protein